MQYFDSLLYDEMMDELTSNELRLLKTDSVLWVMEPADVDYVKMLHILPHRKRMLPKALLMRQALDTAAKLDTDPYPFAEEEDGQGEAHEECS